jgi:hypothetical protein
MGTALEIGTPPVHLALTSVSETTSTELALIPFWLKKRLYPLVKKLAPANSRYSLGGEPGLIEDTDGKEPEALS